MDLYNETDVFVGPPWAAKGPLSLPLAVLEALWGPFLGPRARPDFFGCVCRFRVFSVFLLAPLFAIPGWSRRIEIVVLLQ